ncbi:S53 family peptidase [Nocardia stercoris]|uniref:S53 family peptidase n=1 Tax=Nocardia stercoris TaxID=2483361 RepID=UPI0018F59A51|nr:S53 family peptidase [Nocardia stercoris]
MRWNWPVAVAVGAAVVVSVAPSAGADPKPGHGWNKNVCGDAAEPGKAHCHARVVTDAAGNVAVYSTPPGFTPADLRSAYNVTGNGSSATTIAIVDAMGYANAESDLAVYRSQFGLPPCTSANGCFQKVGQNGSTTGLPAEDTGWAQESALDLDMASAICPNCRIVLLEAASGNLGDLATAANTAVTKFGAKVVSNSYGGSENGAAGLEWAYNHPGVAVVASSGDKGPGGFDGSGGGLSFPASSAHVVAIGGTSLTRDGSARGWSETAWSDAGSGCSVVFGKPVWQKDSGCGHRMSADVSAVADPNTGVAVYGPTGSGSGWLQVGGTSVSAPLIGGMYALAGGGADGASTLYTGTMAFNDVSAGSTGTCTPAYICTAGAGYDGPTGLGTPNGSFPAPVVSAGGSTGSSGSAG